MQNIKRTVREKKNQSLTLTWTVMWWQILCPQEVSCCNVKYFIISAGIAESWNGEPVTFRRRPQGASWNVDGKLARDE